MNNSTHKKSYSRSEGTHNIVIGQKITSIKLQRAKEFRRNMTPEEKIIWQHLRANHLQGYHFRRQQIIDGFIADFYCHPTALVLEIDGKIHENQIEYDAQRDKVLSARGLRLLRIKNEEIKENIDKVLKHILQACQT